jgi:hypothetical protein
VLTVSVVVALVGLFANGLVDGLKAGLELELPVVVGAVVIVNG